MKKIIYPLLLVCAAFTCVEAQQHSCGTDAVFAEQIKTDPTVLQRMKQFNQNLQRQLDAKGKANSDSDSDIDQVITIPVVFHVFHTNGPENISRAQILDQIRILNEDYNRTNADATNTDSLFKPLAANMRVRFELAKRDPQGRCSDGVVRVYSPYTLNADDAIKKISVWPNQHYLNIWVVKSIKDRGAGGTILGYAQFPWILQQGQTQSNVTDGVLIRADYIGSIGTSDMSKAGRVATHEIGHWLGLFHPFQDGCDGGDQVNDTPPVKDANFGCTPRNSCSNDIPDLPDMIQNFMDYADGSCQNLFTLGQKDRARSVIFNNRMDLWSPANLFATGITDPAAQTCNPVLVAAAFASNALPCAGSNVTFYDCSYNGNVSARVWEFPGGTPSTATTANPVVQYASPGVYDIKLTVTNANGSNTTQMLQYIQVLPSAPVVQAPFAETMENLYLAKGSWYVDGTSPNSWKITDVVDYSGNKCLTLSNNFVQTGNTHNLYSPAFSTIGMPTPYVAFAYSYAQKSMAFIGSQAGVTNDRFTLSVSTDCGNTWSNVWSKQGNALNTLAGTVVPELNFVPSGSDMWKVVSVGINSASNKNNVRLRFQFTSDGGGSMYLDDININATGVLSAPGLVKPEAFVSLYPNPAGHIVYLKSATQLDEVNITDAAGKQVDGWQLQTVSGMEKAMPADGFAPGVYAVTVRSGQQKQTLKLVITR